MKVLKKKILMPRKIFIINYFVVGFASTLYYTIRFLNVKYFLDFFYRKRLF